MGITENKDGSGVSGEFSKDDLCRIWFEDVKNACYLMEFTEEDIAPEDFILLWYEIDV